MHAESNEVGVVKKILHTAPATDEAKEWDGWGTALKPAHEPILMFRKPLSENTVAANVLKWGTGGINIDVSRVATNPDVDDMSRKVERKKRKTETWEEGSGFKNETNALTGVLPTGRFPANLIHDGSDDVEEGFPKTGKSAGGFKLGSTGSFGKSGIYSKAEGEAEREGTGFGDQGSASRYFKKIEPEKPDGRFPANLIHDGSEEVKEGFPYTKSGAMKREVEGYEGESNTGFIRGVSGPQNQHGDSGSAARFFKKVETASRIKYCAKASKKDRDEDNKHPTVKPTELMRYLINLVTPPGGKVLDMFAGSGSTGKACVLDGFGFIGIEREKASFDTSVSRIKKHLKGVE